MTLDSRLRIVVLGSLIRFPMGGIAWHHLQYVLGLKELGHDAYFLEDSNDYEWSCYDPVRNVSDKDPTYGLRFAKAVFDKVGLEDRWAYHDAHTAQWFGPCASSMAGICASADLLVNLGHSNPLRPWVLDIPSRSLVDTDPVFTQIRHLEDESSRARALCHTAFFSFGENIGTNAYVGPNDGFDWQPTRQPIVLDRWQVAPPHREAKFTTVMQWDSYAPRTFEGTEYGMKSASFPEFMNIPLDLEESASFELVVGSESAPRDALLQSGWSLGDPFEVTKDPWTYQDYLRNSKAEFAVAKHGYVAGNTGWFSERSTGYLATGRPVVVQETGFSRWLPTGSGVLAFSDRDEAAQAVLEVEAHYEEHCIAARRTAEEAFDSRLVLGDLVERSLSI